MLFNLTTFEGVQKIISDLNDLIVIIDMAFGKVV